jgi:hypothetical protein
MVDCPLARGWASVQYAWGLYGNRRRAACSLRSTATRPTGTSRWRGGSGPVGACSSRRRTSGRLPQERS